MNLNDNIQFLSLRLQTNPDSYLFARLADTLLNNGEVDKAIEVCEDGLKRHPYYVTAHFVMGKCYLQKKMYDQAEKEFKRVLFFDPKFLAAHKYYAEIMQHIGWDNAVENSYRNIIQIDPLDQETRDELTRMVAEKKESLQDEDTLPFPDSDVVEASASPENDESEPIASEEIEEEEKEEATQSTEETLTDDKETNLGEEIFEAVIEEEPPSAEEEEKFSYILDDIFREESAIDDEGVTFEPEQPELENQEEDIADDIFSTPESKPETTGSEELPEGFFSENETEQSRDETAGKEDFLTQETDSDSPEENEEVIPRHKLTPTPTPRPSQEQSEVDDLKELARDVQTNGKPGEPVKAKNIQKEFDETPPENEISTPDGLKRKKEKIVTPTLGEIYAAQGQYAKAIGVFEILRKKEPTNSIYIDKIKYLKQKLEEASKEA